MKLAWDFTVISGRQLAAVIWLVSAASSCSGAPFSAVWARATVAGAGLLAGFVLAREPIRLVAHRPNRVLAQIQNTLESTCIEHQVSDNSVKVRATGTIANVKGLGPWSLVRFRIVDRSCNQERFLLELLTKYLAITEMKDADE